MTDAHPDLKPKIGALFRTCRKSDLPAVQKLADELYASDPGVQHVRPDVGLTLQEFTERPEKGRLIAFEADGQIVGYAIIVFFWSNEYSGNLIEIDEMCIAESARGAGIGSTLFKWLESEFPTDLKGFTLQVAHHNQGAFKLYERLGFSISRNQHMIRIIDE